MIITKTKTKINTFNQKTYDTIAYSIFHKKIECNTCHSSSWCKHCCYTRYIYHFGKRVKINILRIRCMSCGKTHAILIQGIIPYLITTHEEVIETLTSIISYYDHYLKKKFTGCTTYDEMVIQSSRNFLLTILT